MKTLNQIADEIGNSCLEILFCNYDAESLEAEIKENGRTILIAAETYSDESQFVYLNLSVTRGNSLPTLGRRINVKDFEQILGNYIEGRASQGYDAKAEAADHANDIAWSDGK